MFTNESTLLIQKDKKEPSNSSPSPVIRQLQNVRDQYIDNHQPAFRTFAEQEKTITPNDGIFVKVDGRYKKIMTDGIYLVEALSDYMNIYTHEKRYVIHSTLYALLEKLPKEHFVRVHKSFVVRLDCISAIDHNLITVKDRQIPVGKTHKEELVSRLNILF